MTIDERLEALTQNVKSLVAMHRDSEATFEASMAEIRANSAEIRRATNRLESPSERLEQLLRAIRNIEQRNE